MKNISKRLVLLMMTFIFLMVPFNNVQAVGDKAPLINLECPVDDFKMVGDLKISGWTLNMADTDKVNIYIDGKIIGQAVLGIDRPDVGNIFPGYPNGNASGFEYNLKITDIAIGSHVLLVEALGKDGSKIVQGRTISIGNTPITAKATATKEQAQEWARKKNATDTFIGLAEKYWKLAPLNGGIDPVVAFAQAAKETGYGQFKGVLNDSFNNPCGLKTSQGGADSDPNAHTRFPDWETGVIAQLDHLALYAGVNGYPKSNTPDPRHFPTIAGKAPYVEALGGKWAPSPTYGFEITRMMREIQQTVVPIKYHQKMWIETPGIEADIELTSALLISGWALNEIGVKEVNILVDDKPHGKASLSQDRLDVNKVYSIGYQTGYGFAYNLSASDILNGVHRVTVVVIGSDNSNTTQSITVRINK
jgi:hypothetical protein